MKPFTDSRRKPTVALESRLNMPGRPAQSANLLPTLIVTDLTRDPFELGLVRKHARPRGSIPTERQPVNRSWISSVRAYEHRVRTGEDHFRPDLPIGLVQGPHSQTGSTWSSRAILGGRRSR